jgi:hypothetical protein
MHRIAAVLALVLSLLSPFARALNTWGTDMSDLWWNPDESGWGMNIAHQREVIFATFFVYGANNQLKWYVASNLSSQGGGFTFQGPLHETTGPYLGGAFNPTLVSSRPVGTVSITFTEVSRANLSYTVDGAAVAKSIQRQTFRRAELSGNYFGAAIATVTGCAGVPSFGASATFSVTLSPLPSNAIAISSQLATGSSCSYSGTYAQSGRMGAISGTFSCTGNVPSAGSFEASEVEAGAGLINIRYVARSGACVETGRLGGLSL